MSKENKYKRQYEERANEHMRKAFERFASAIAIMSQVRGKEEWTPEELEKIAKIVNEWASTLLRISEKMAKRHRSRKGAEE
jgi:hypothetical protein